MSEGVVQDYGDAEAGVNAGERWRAQVLTGAAPGRPLLTYTQIDARDERGQPMEVYRAKVPGGWLLMFPYVGDHVYIPDPTHEWDGGTLP